MKPLDERGRTTLRGTCKRLQLALQVEHYTLPPYLYALLSVDEESNPHAWRVLRAVLMEEMLHLALVANLLNALGTAPTLRPRDLLLRYPSPPPRSSGRPVLGLRPLSPAVIADFARLEQPTSAEAFTVEGYLALGQVYSVLLGRLAALCEEYGDAAIFTGDPARQVGGEDYYGGRGALRPITDLPSAQAAFDVILSQGEGACRDGVSAVFAGSDDRELGHYQRFIALGAGRHWGLGDRLDALPTGAPAPVDFSAVRPLLRDPSLRALDLDPAARDAVRDANAAYGALLHALHRTFNGEPGALRGAVAKMYAFREQAWALGNIPYGEHRLGPTFEVED